LTLQALLDYDHWANQEVIKALMDYSTPRALSLMAHIIAAERVWLSRIRGEESPVAVWPDLTIEECMVLAAELPARWRSVLDDFVGEKLATVIRYTSIKGEPFENTVEQMILQVVTHSGYHRGQIASEMRAAGVTPASTDFIVAVRHGHVK
jgi:uncharacterized damage-inducible protein DinB